MLLVSAVSVAACGGRAEDSGHEGAPGSPRPTSGGDGDEFVGEIGTEPPRSTGDVWVDDVEMGEPCCDDDYLMGAGAGNFDDGDVDSLGGAGGARADDGLVGIRIR